MGSGEGQFIFKLQDIIARAHADGNDPVEKKVLKEARGMESSTQVRERNKDSSFIIMIIIIISHFNSSMLVDLVRTC